MGILGGPHLGAFVTCEQRMRELGLYSRGDLINACKHFMGEEETEPESFQWCELKEAKGTN